MWVVMWGGCCVVVWFRFSFGVLGLCCDSLVGYEWCEFVVCLLINVL